MRIPGRSTLIGAYLCPRGAFVVECKRAAGGFAVQRTFEVPLPLESTIAAADHLTNVLRSAGISRGDVAIVLRGFGVTHHILQMPPATDEMLTPIVDREMHRLEPQLGKAVVGWIPLPPFAGGGPETVGQRSILAAAIPADVASELQGRVEESGYKLVHLTALPATMQRLFEEFDTETDTAALVAALPDGAFLGFALDRGLRLIVEPPLPQGADHDSAALGEELELGTMFVRQQFRGAEVNRIAIVGSGANLADLETTLTDRLRVPAKPLGVADVSPAAFAALGALVDAQSPRPLSLGGVTRELGSLGKRSALDSAAMAAVLLVALLGVWVTTEVVRTKQTMAQLQATRRRVEQDSFGLAPLRTTANSRRNVRNAAAALQLVVNDRVELQQALSGIASVIRPPMEVDTLLLRRSATGWSATLTGNVGGATNARAVQTLHDAYRELPQRANVDSLHLDALSYADTLDRNDILVRFELSFAVRPPRKGGG